MRGVRVKAASWGFLHHIRFYNKILPNDSNYLHTQQRTQDCLDLTQSSYAVRRLSAKRLGRGGTLGRPTRRSSFLKHIRQPCFRARPTQAFSHIRASFMRDDGKNSIAVGRNPLAVKASASSRHFSSPTMAIFSMC